MRFQLRAGRALSRVFVLSPHVGRHIWQVDGLDVLLHVLLDLVLIEVFESSIVNHVANYFITGSTLLNNHFSTELAVSLGSLTYYLGIFNSNLVVAFRSISLDSHSIQLLLVIAIDVEHVND